MEINNGPVFDDNLSVFAYNLIETILDNNQLTKDNITDAKSLMQAVKKHINDNKNFFFERDNSNTTISGKDAEKIYEIIKPYIDRSKGKKD